MPANTQGASARRAKGASPSKWRGANDSAARDRYWLSKRLQHRKVRQLVRCNGMSEAEALAHWLRTRKKRMRAGVRAAATAAEA